MKKISRYKKIIIFLAIIIGMLFIDNSKAYSAYNPYPVNGAEGSTGEWSNCTWSVWQLVYNSLGIELPNWNWAGNWYYAAQNSGYVVGSEPRANSIICYNNHVSFVTGVSGSQVYIKEGGYGEGAYKGYHEGYSNAYGSREYTNQPILGYIYLNPNWYETKQVAYIGENIYGYLGINDGWIGAIDDNRKVVLGQSLKENTKQVWNFKRQSDGSYTIRNCESNRYLDVYQFNDYDGGVVQTHEYNGSTAQKWYIYGPASGPYFLKPQCSNRVLDVYGGNNRVGDKLNLWTYNGGNAQIFAIWELKKAGKSKLQYSISNQKATFTWTKASETTKYKLVIKKGKAGNVSKYKTINVGTNTSYSISLPVGYYEVYVESSNFYSSTASNILKFNVIKPVDISKAKVSAIKNQTYTGKNIIPSLIVKYGNKTLKKGADYALVYSNNKNTGKATIKITGKGNYKGTKNVTFKITPSALTGLKVKAQSQKAIKLTWTKNGGNVTGYRIFKYDSKTKKNIYIGKTTKNVYIIKNLKPATTYKYRVIAYKTIDKKDYRGRIAEVSTTTMTKTPAITLKAGSKKATVNWKKIAGATGYEVYMATSKNGIYTKKVTITNNTTFTYTQKNLTKAKTYYFKIRTYRTVAGKKTYSNFSSIKSVKVK